MHVSDNNWFRFQHLLRLASSDLNVTLAQLRFGRLPLLHHYQVPSLFDGQWTLDGVREIRVLSRVTPFDFKTGDLLADYLEFCFLVGGPHPF